jgi:hypothetical protein
MVPRSAAGRNSQALRAACKYGVSLVRAARIAIGSTTVLSGYTGAIEREVRHLDTVEGACLLAAPFERLVATQPAYPALTIC